MSTQTEKLRSVIDEHNGEYEVPAVWVKKYQDAVRFIDVREPHELDGPLGKAEGVENIPLLILLSQSASLDPEVPLVLICRSGRRSGEAARQLRHYGLAAASVEGGMIAWNSEVLGRTNVLSAELSANTAVLADAVRRTNGLPEVSPRWTSAHIGGFRFIDVRENDELVRDGKAAQSEHIPLGKFMEVAQGFDRDQPMVVMCKSGGRSGRAVRALEAAGFSSVASMEGGILGWRASGLPTV